MSEDNTNNTAHFDNTDENEIEVRDIYKRLLADQSIVLTMYRQDLRYMRKQLSTIKTRDQAKLKDAGLEPDNTTLEFTVYTKYPDVVDDKISRIVQVNVEMKESVKIKVIGEITVLDGGLT